MGCVGGCRRSGWSPGGGPCRTGQHQLRPREGPGHPPTGLIGVSTVGLFKACRRPPPGSANICCPHWHIRARNHHKYNLWPRRQSSICRSSRTGATSACPFPSLRTLALLFVVISKCYVYSNLYVICPRCLSLLSIQMMFSGDGKYSSQLISRIFELPSVHSLSLHLYLNGYMPYIRYVRLCYPLLQKKGHAWPVAKYYISPLWWSWFPKQCHAY